MSRLERLRSLVNQRMNAAAEDIGRMLEGKVSEYEEEARFFREENNSLQHKILKLASKSDVQVMVMDADDSSCSENQDSPQDQASTAPPMGEQEHQEETPDKPPSRRRQSLKTQDAKDSESEEEEEDSESSDEGEDDGGDYGGDHGGDHGEDHREDHGEDHGGDHGEDHGGDQGVRRTKRKAPQLKEEKVKRSRK